MLEKDYKYYEKNRTVFVEKYSGKVIVIKDQKVIGIYENKPEALSATIKDHEIGTFLIQQVVPVEQDEVQMFYSNAVFV